MQFPLWLFRDVTYATGVCRPGAHHLPRVHAVRADQDQARGRDHAGGSRPRTHCRSAAGPQGGVRYLPYNFTVVFLIAHMHWD